MAVANSISGGNYFSDVNLRAQRDLERGQGPNAQHLSQQSGVAQKAKKSTVKKGGNVAEEGATSQLSPAAREAIKTEAQHHSDHIAEHGQELAHEVGLDTGEDGPGEAQIESKQGWERPEVPDGALPDGRYKITSPEDVPQAVNEADYIKLTGMDDADNTWDRVTGDIPDVQFQAAEAALETQMAKGVSQVAVLKVSPDVDAVAQKMEIQPQPPLAEPMGIVEPGNDKISGPMSLELPPEMERIAAERAAAQLAAGDFQEEAMIAGMPGLSVTATPTAISSQPPAPAVDPAKPEVLRNNHNTIEVLKDSPAELWGGLAEVMGVEVGQGMGQTLSENREQAHAQKLQWRVGHALQLQAAGEGEVAREVLQGGWDQLAGKSVLQAATANSEITQQFDLHYRDHDAQMKEDILNTSPQEMAGRHVAMLVPNKETGILEEVRGKVVPPRDSWSAEFRLEGSDEVFNNNFIDSLAILPEEKTPSMPEVVLPPVTELPTQAPPSPTSLSREEVVARAARLSSPAASAALLEKAEIPADWATGADYKPENKLQWQLGQARSLSQQGHTPGDVKDVLNGKWDNLAGDKIGPKIEQRNEFRADFQKHYHKHKAAKADGPPEDWYGQTVAFLRENPETKEFEEIRGKVKFGEGRNSSLFEIEGRQGEVFNNNFVKDVRILPHDRIPPFAQVSARLETASLPPGATAQELKQFSDPLAQLHKGTARSHLNPEQKRDLEQVENDVKTLRRLYSEMSERPYDAAFQGQAQSMIQAAQARVGQLAGRYDNAQGPLQVTVDPKDGEVYTTLRWQNDKLSSEMKAMGYQGMAYSLTSSPGRENFDLQALPLKEGKPDGTSARVQVATGNPQQWQGVSASVTRGTTSEGYQAGTIYPGDPRLQVQSATPLSAASETVAAQVLGDAGLKWPDSKTGQAQGRQDYWNVPGQTQRPVKPGFLDRVRYAFTGNDKYLGGPPMGWQSPPPPYYPGGYPGMMTTVPYSYPGYAGSWNTGWGGQSWGGGWGGGYGGGGMNSMMKFMMATTLIGSVVTPMAFFMSSMRMF